MATIDSTGFIRDRLDVIKQNVDAAIREIYGADCDLSPSSSDGQWAGIFAEAVDTVGQLAEDVFAARSPVAARGAALSRLVKINGITRNPASYSTADVMHAGTPGTVIPDASLVDTTDVPAAHFQTVGGVTIGSDGTVAGVVRATATGPVFGGAGKITVIKTVISGWTSVTNAANANLGSDVETDEDLRVRRTASVALNSTSIVDGLYAALANVQGVSDVAVFENKTGSPLSRPGATDLPANSINVVVRGGLDADIGAAIWAKSSGGVTLVGSTSAGVVDAQGVQQSMKFDRPLAMSIYFDVFLRRLPGQLISAATIALVKQAVADYGNANSIVGSSVLFAPLFGAVITGLGTIESPPSVAGIGVGSYRGLLSPSAADLAIPFNAFPEWDAANGYVYVYESDGTQGVGFGPY